MEIPSSLFSAPVFQLGCYTAEFRKKSFELISSASGVNFILCQVSHEWEFNLLGLNNKAKSTSIQYKCGLAFFDC